MYEYAAHRTQHIVQRPSYAHRTAHNTSRLGRFFSPLLFSPLLSSSLLFSLLLSSSLLNVPTRWYPHRPRVTRAKVCHGTVEQVFVAALGDADVDVPFFPTVDGIAVAKL